MLWTAFLPSCLLHCTCRGAMMRPQAANAPPALCFAHVYRQLVNVCPGRQDDEAGNVVRDQIRPAELLRYTACMAFIVARCKFSQVMLVVRICRVFFAPTTRLTLSRPGRQWWQSD